MAIVFYLLNLIQVFLQHFASLRRTIPSGGLVDNRHDGLVADYSPDIDGIVHSSEDSTLVGVLDVDIFEQLEPQSF